MRLSKDKSSVKGLNWPHVRHFKMFSSCMCGACVTHAQKVTAAEVKFSFILWRYLPPQKIYPLYIYIIIYACYNVHIHSPLKSCNKCRLLLERSKSDKLQQLTVL